MLKLNYIILDQLGETEEALLKRNIEKDKEVQLICLHKETEWECGRALKLAKPDQSLLISENGNRIKEMSERGMATVSYVPPQLNGHRNTGEGMQTQQGRDAGTDRLSDLLPGLVSGMESADILAEGFDEVDLQFLTHVYERKHHLPWTILETARCVVRELTLDDLDDLFHLYEGEGMTEFLDPLYEYEKEKEYQKAYIEHMYRYFGYGMWLVFEKNTQKLIGRIGVEHREELGGELELGYVVGTSCQRKGYAFEVCRAVLSYVRDYLEVPYINCLIEKGNTVSEHLAVRLGFLFTEEIKLDGKSMKKYRYYFC